MSYAPVQAAEAPPRPPPGESSLVFSLLMSAAGAGLLSFPYACRQAGWALIVAGTLAFAAMSAYTLRLLARATRRHAAGMREQTLEELCRAGLGARSHAACCAANVLGSLGGLTGFFDIIGDLARPAAERLLGADSFFAHDAVLVGLFAGAVVLPLCLAPSLHDIKLASMLGVAAVLGVAGCVVGRAGGGSLSLEEAVGSAPGAAVPLVVFSLGCHGQITPLVGEMPGTPLARVERACALSSALCAALYLATGLAGYAQFGADTEGDVLKNYAVDDALFDGVKLVMAVHIALAAPVVLYPGRRTLEALLPFSPLAVNVACLAACAALAVLVPAVQDVFGFVGATTAVAQIYWFPGALAGKRWVQAVGVVVGVVSLWVLSGL